MITKLYKAESLSTNPYHNLAYEKLLFDSVDDGEMILYLWQNRHTVVCGRNQNIYKECLVSRLLGDGGFPARRLSGGGAVFHDMGNLNFTFLVKDGDYDVDRQLSVLLKACASLGLGAEKTGRNDVTIEGKKFSGNAFYSSGGRRYHHGTIMVDIDTDMLSHYLNVDKSKLEAKGVSSVRSRVANLTDFLPSLTIETMKDKMWEAFEAVYGLSAAPIEIEHSNALEETEQYFGSDEWLYGTAGSFSMRLDRRFDWGDFDLNIDAQDGKINRAALYSDALDEEYIRAFAEAIQGTALTAVNLKGIADALAGTEEQRQMAGDIAGFLFEEL
jgi:lipoate-protein ligase A